MTANQLYKESGSSLPFKEWLKQNQNKGLLDNHEKMFNLMGVDGDTEEEVIEQVQPKPITTKKAKTNMGMLKIVGIIGLGILLYGLANAKSE
ncbi:hypothetical protein [Winogradskyella sp.]|jgi:hypothetical protein|uniref:hypothetical protein n=1 Tax=Winogradskyella sp. TaxID=1883156 RepID=UPI003F69D335